jgi:uncharacterized protein with FMN-binding domain
LLKISKGGIGMKFTNPFQRILSALKQLGHRKTVPKLNRQYLLAVLIPLVLIGIAAAFFTSLTLHKSNMTGETTLSSYKDGVYEGSSQSVYTSESYHGIAKVYIKQHRITKVDFKIIDQSKDVIFDQNYGPKYFAGNEYYIKQSENDWHGVQIYPKELMLSQDLNKVDAITGATWSYNIFKDSVAKALEKAK